MIMLEDVQRVARKPHACDWRCGEPIEAGEQYRAWAYPDDGRIVRLRMHIECFEALQRSQADALEGDPLCDETHQRGAMCGH